MTPSPYRHQSESGRRFAHTHYGSNLRDVSLMARRVCSAHARYLSVHSYCHCDKITPLPLRNNEAVCHCLFIQTCSLKLKSHGCFMTGTFLDFTFIRIRSYVCFDKLVRTKIISPSLSPLLLI